MNDDLNAPGAALVPPTTATDAILRPRERGIGIHQLAQLLGIPREHDPALETVTFPTRAVRERDVLVRAGDPCDSLYVVRCGCFKTSVLDAYGGIQGTGFPMTGDVIGADGLATGAYASDAVALDHGEVVVISVPRLGPLSGQHPHRHLNPPVPVSDRLPAAGTARHRAASSAPGDPPARSRTRHARRGSCRGPHGTAR